MDIEKFGLFRKKLRQLELEISGLLKENKSCWGITLSQCHTLLEIGRMGDLSMIDLASELGLDASTLSRSIDGLVKRGLVKRKQNPDDRRYVSLTLSKKGKNFFDSIEDYYNKYFFQLFKYIPEEKHLQVVESFFLFSDAMKKMKDTGRRLEDEKNKSFQGG